MKQKYAKQTEHSPLFVEDTAVKQSVRVNENHLLSCRGGFIGKDAKWPHSSLLFNVQYV